MRGRFALFMHANVAKIVVPDARTALARMAANFYRHPSHRVTLVGVTGTNGKTTTTYLIKSVLEAAGNTVGLIGTIQYSIGDEVIPATHTTPESLDVNTAPATRWWSADARRRSWKSRLTLWPRSGFMDCGLKLVFSRI